MKCFNGFTGETVDMPDSMSIHQMRSKSTHKNGGGYHIITDAQLKRDLQGRTLKDVYRDNHAGRLKDMDLSDKGVVMGVYYSPPFAKYQPRSDINSDLRSEYLAWCAERNHTPHPASLDSDHPLNCHRLKAPKAERVSEAKDVLQFHVNRMIAAGSPVIAEIAA